MAGELCDDLFDLPELPDPADRRCLECVAIGDIWVNLRMCLECGNVGCCESSKNTHAIKHFQATGHPTMRSVMPNQHWAWCYVHEQAKGL